MLIYFSAYFFNALISFAGVSVLTQPAGLSPEDYGIINLYSSFIIFLMPFCTGGILYPLSVEYFKKEKGEYRNFFSNAQVIPLISTVLLTLAVALFHQRLAAFLGVSSFWIFMLPVTAWWVMLNETTMIITRNENKPARFAFFSVGKNLAEIVLTIVLVIGLQQAWQGRLWSSVAAASSFAVVSFLYFRQRGLIAAAVDWEKVRLILFLGFPYIFERLAVFVLGYSDRYFINEFDPGNTTEVGYYGLGAQFAQILFLVIISLNSAYQPFLFRRLAAGARKVIHKSTVWYMGACAVTLGGLYIAIPMLFDWFIGEKFWPAKQYAFILCGGYFMWGIYNAFVAYLIFLEKSRLILYISLAGMLLSVCLNLLLVPRYGAISAAITSVVTYFCMAVFCFWSVRKYYIQAA